MSEGVKEYLENMDVPTHLIEEMFQYSSDEVKFIGSDSVKLMSKIPFFEEWIIASCEPLNELEYEEYIDLEIKEVKVTEALTKSENFYLDHLREKDTKAQVCKMEKLLEIQLKEL